MNYWKDKHVLVTGGSGMVGSYVSEMLLERGAKVSLTAKDSLDSFERNNLQKILGSVSLIPVDLRNLDDCYLATENQDVVMNLAARVGGIEYNRMHPGTMFRDNILISSNMLDAAVKNDVGKFLVVSSACVYPRDCTIPTPEEEGFKGTPEPTNDGYGWAKRMAEFQANAYNREFGLPVTIVRPYNCYGPRDHFDARNGHVIAAIIKRIYDGENPLVVWGSGEQTRAFLYVEDFARGLIEVTEKYSGSFPLNLGVDEEIKIKDLVGLIVEITGKDIEIGFDLTKPDGQPRRNCDITKLRDELDFKPKFTLKEGLTKTIDWYKKEFNI